MRKYSSEDVRSFLLELIEGQLASNGYSSEDVCDDFDLLTRGVVDSLGFLEITIALQEEFAMELDFDEVDPEQLSIVGPLCQYISSNSKVATEVIKFLDLNDSPDTEQCASEVLTGIHDAGNPFYDWFFGGSDSARRALGKRLCRPTSELSVKRVRVHFLANRPVGGFLGLSGEELYACRKADMFTLMKEMKSDSNFDLSERFAATRKLFPRVKPDTYYLSKMWINPHYRGKGMGHEVLQGFLQVGREAGFKTFKLDVSADNQPAIRLYQSCGFQTTDKSSFPKAGLEYLSMQLEQ